MRFSRINKTALLTLFCVFLLCFCTFDYGDRDSSGEELPDLVMENVEYVRVRSADPLARIHAERFERYENLNLMKVQNFVFEQFGERGEDVNIFGKAGRANVNIESGDIFMDDNVSLDVKTEDIILETYQLSWQDESKALFTGENDEIHIFRENGTMFTGIGLLANTRTRLWEFLGNVSGIYIYEGDEGDVEF
jgi:LPS export ABC transporter protein LptC